jgi:hypothetical protein
VGQAAAVAAVAVTFVLALRRSCLNSVYNPLATLAEQHHLKQHNKTAAAAAATAGRRSSRGSNSGSGGSRHYGGYRCCSQ